jgi:hypothetical protein
MLLEQKREKTAAEKRKLRVLMRDGVKKKILRGCCTLSETNVRG